MPCANMCFTLIHKNINIKMHEKHKTINRYILLFDNEVMLFWLRGTMSCAFMFYSDSFSIKMHENH